MTIKTYKLDNGQITVTLTNIGASLISLKTADKNGQLGEITMSYANAEDYQFNPASLGATVGRVINRIKNGRFHYAGKDYQLKINNGKNHLHGYHEFSTAVWNAESCQHNNNPAVKFRYYSEAGSGGGYPGNLSVEVIYSLSGNNELIIEYFATSDQVTPVNLSNHSYWNLAGSNSVLQHELQIKADYYLPTDETSMITGEVLRVNDTLFDFRNTRKIEQGFSKLRNGYDVCFAINKAHDELALAAVLADPQSGRVMEVYTDQPGIQLYTSNHIHELDAKKVAQPFQQYQAVCLETQNFPDAVNRSYFPSPFLYPGEHYYTKTVHRFYVNN